MSFALIVVCVRDDAKTAAENASDVMLLGAVLTLCKFSLLVRQLNHSNLSFKAIDNAPNQLYQKMGICPEQTISKSVKANILDLMARKSHPVHEEKIDMICTAMDAVVHEAEKVSATKGRQCLVRQNGA